MKILEGKNTDAKVFTDDIEELAKKQIKGMLDHDITKNTQVRIMPDVHAGKGSTIGTTIRLPEYFKDWKVSPNVVGVDIGCGIMMYKLGKKEFTEKDLEELDKRVNEGVPAGFNVHEEYQDKEFTDKILGNLTFDLGENKRDWIGRSLGTLGGGNHFIELGVDEEGNYWLSVHSGSRNLGVQVANYHQDKALESKEDVQGEAEDLINKLKEEGRHQEIETKLKEYKKNLPKTKGLEKDLAYLEGELLEDYLNDMKLAQRFASKSREKMLDIIVKGLGLEVKDSFDSVHNFIEVENGMIRKGATSAKAGERLVIPLNMRDGSIIAKGKGNKDWNNSAPHGAGRLMSRRKAMDTIKLEDFTNQMEGVYSTSVVESTLDEAPDAYKPSEVIKEQIEPTAEILQIVKPIYNFKSK